MPFRCLTSCLDKDALYSLTRLLSKIKFVHIRLRAERHLKVICEMHRGAVGGTMSAVWNRHNQL